VIPPGGLDVEIVKINQRGEVTLHFSELIFKYANTTFFNDTENPVLDLNLIYGGGNEEPVITNWWIKHWRDDQILIQLLFDEPLKVSPSSILDKLNLTFLQAEFFFSLTTQSTVEHELQLEHLIPNQIVQNSALDILQSSMGAFMVVSSSILVGNMWLVFFMGGPLQLFWAFINAI